MEKKRWRLAAVKGTMAMHLLLLLPAAGGRVEGTQNYTMLVVRWMRPLVFLVWVGSKQGKGSEEGGVLGSVNVGNIAEIK